MKRIIGNVIRRAIRDYHLASVWLLKEMSQWAIIEEQSKERGEGVSRAILVVISPPFDSRYQKLMFICDIGSIRLIYIPEFSIFFRMFYYYYHLRFTKEDSSFEFYIPNLFDQILINVRARFDILKFWYMCIYTSSY